MTPRMRWIALAAATLLGAAAAGWRARPPTARDAAPAGAPALAPAAMKVKPGGTSWNPDPATKPAPVEAQRGGPDIAGAQPLRPPPSASP
ncbi:Uncharacterised protein [Burkholderia pseudomallei]|uniref:hypothetical protein n=1 Tax=Burkholderia pseudomallei TaxID=28450 RepID=UPI000F2BC33B|nr:hypothetical protein [Burkholderia pseudomallei]VCK22164.1 Uncharacterised protein [Burkholderia pseudomallei]